MSDTAGHKRCRELYPVLGACEHDGCTAPAVDRHHIDGDPFNNARSNVAFLCRRHHMAVDGRGAILGTFKVPVRLGKPCSNCQRSAKPLRRGRCGACNEYLRRTGEERPVDASGQPLVRRFVGRVA